MGREDQTLGQLILTAEPPRHDSFVGEGGMPGTADQICCKRRKSSCGRSSRRQTLKSTAPPA